MLKIELTNKEVEMIIQLATSFKPAGICWTYDGPKLRRMGESHCKIWKDIRSKLIKAKER